MGFAWDPRLTPMAGPCAMVLFGASGDLAHKKLLPALYDLANRGLLPAGFALVGVARRDWSEADLRREAHAAVASGARTPFRQQVWENFAARLHYVSGDVANPATYKDLALALQAADVAHSTRQQRLFYLALPPDRCPVAVQGLLDSGLAGAPGHGGRLVVERPYGFDLVSSKQLNYLIDQGFCETEVCRMDPYLGNELVRTFVALRFANRLFDAVWNRDHVSHVEITMGEDQGIGARAGYWDQLGALRDIVTGHMFQLLALTAMDQPASMAAVDVRAARQCALRQIELAGPVSKAAARGQYTAGWQGNIQVKGYLDEPGVIGGSTTETYAALKLAVDTDRWRGVPFYLRTGKRLGRRITQITLLLKPTAWAQTVPALAGQLEPNLLTIRMRPDSGVTMRIDTKVPNTQTQVRPVTVDFSHGYTFAEALPEGFEQELFDVLVGVPPYQASSSEVSESWRVVEPVLKAWQASNKPPARYPAGSWGPKTADRLLARDGKTWRRP